MRRRRLLCILGLLPPLLSGVSGLQYTGDEFDWPGSIIDPANSCVWTSAAPHAPDHLKDANALNGVRRRTARDTIRTKQEAPADPMKAKRKTRATARDVLQFA